MEVKTLLISSGFKTIKTVVVMHQFMKNILMYTGYCSFKVYLLFKVTTCRFCYDENESVEQIFGIIAALM